MVAPAELSTRVSWERRRRKKPDLAQYLKAAGIKYTFLANDAQDDLILQLRSEGNRIHDASRTKLFASMHEAIEFIAARLFTNSSFAVAMAFDPIDEPAILADPKNLLLALESDSGFFWSDGLILIASDRSEGVILDIADDHPFEVTLLGLAS